MSLPSLIFMPPSIPGYLIERELGRGGGGTVYLAVQLALGRRVALKVLRTNNIEGSTIKFRLCSEAMILAQLQHPGIVQIYSWEDVGDLSCLVMEYLEGGSLDRVCGRVSLNSKDTAHIVRQIADAVQAAHEAGIVHRDIKPGNVLLAGWEGDLNKTSEEIQDVSRWRVKVTDFGLALRMNYRNRMTRHSVIVGTPQYMSPEQMRGDQETGPKSDIYSIGVIMYELMTGRPPYMGTNIEEMVAARIERAPIPPRYLVPNISLDLQTICQKCMDNDPEKRYPTAKALSEDLTRFLGGNPIHARPIGKVGQFVRLCKRNPALTIVSSVLSVLIAISLGTVLALYFDASNARRAIHDALESSNRNYGYAREAVDQLITVLSDQQNQSGDSTSMRDDLLITTMAFYKRVISDRADVPELRAGTAAAWFRLGQVHALRGEVTQAVESYDQAVAIQTLLVASSTQENELPRIELVRMLKTKGQLWMGTIHEKEALPQLRQALAYADKLLTVSPHGAVVKHLRASVLVSLGTILGRQRSPIESKTMFDAALHSLEELVAQHPDLPNYREELVLALMLHLQSFQNTLAPGEPERILRRCVSELEELQAQKPGYLNSQYLLALCLNNLGDYYMNKRQFTDAEPLLNQAEKIAYQLTSSRPYHERFSSLHATISMTKAQVLSGIGRHAEAVETISCSIQLYRAILEKNPRHRTASMYYWLCYRNRANSLEQLRRYDEALADVRKALSRPPANPTDLQELKADESRLICFLKSTP